MTATAKSFNNGAEIHDFIDAAPEVWEYVAAVQADVMPSATAAGALGLDVNSFGWLLQVAGERLKDLARRHEYARA